jgi:hypothetical protein
MNMARLISQYVGTKAWIELLLGAVAVSMTAGPAIFRRRPGADPAVVEGLLERVNEVRRRQFPAGHAHFKAVKARAKLLAATRERIKQEKEFLRQRW